MAAIHGRFTRSQILIQNGMDSDFVLSFFLQGLTLRIPLLPLTPYSTQIFGALLFSSLSLKKKKSSAWRMLGSVQPIINSP